MGSGDKEIDFPSPLRIPHSPLPTDYQLYFNHFATSGSVGRLPYISTPTRYIFAAIQVPAMMVTTNRMIEAAICQAGAAPRAIRRNITEGPKKGINDRMVTAKPFGLARASVESTNDKAKVIETGNNNCCPSSSLETIAPIIA